MVHPVVTAPAFIGVDGCPGGWYAVSTSAAGASVTASVYARFSDLLARVPASSIIAVDIPIGLLDTGSRRCDDLTRRALAPRRRASVFPAPLRAVLGALSHAEASAMRRAIDGKGMSIQSYGIMRKVREVDDALRESPSHAATVFEVHPELCFATLNGGPPMMHAKRTAAGHAERCALLAGVYGDAPVRLAADRNRRDVGRDDVLDALAALWTALRIGRGEHGSLPAEPEHDAQGRRMAICC